MADTENTDERELGTTDETTEEQVTEGSETVETEGNESAESEGNTEGEDTEPETFPRDYVVKLRDENAKYRQRAQRADNLAQRLHTALTAATGRLQDASDLPFDEKHLDDPEALETAIANLLTRKPHLASRKPSGNVGQGMSGAPASVDLAGILRSRA